jgi:hypothetical protein
VLQRPIELTQYTSWVFTRRVHESGLLPSMGSIGDCYDNGMMESFWGRMQTELLNRRWWKTRIELANAIFEYLEIFHNRQRRHSSLGMLSPVEYERLRPESLSPRETNYGGSTQPGVHQSLRQTGGTSGARRVPAGGHSWSRRCQCRPRGRRPRR